MKTIIFIFLGMLLSGCSLDYGPTGYQAKTKNNEGYEEMRLSKTSYLVEYSSNDETNSSTNYKHALRRAAELTTQNNYRYFDITSERNTSRSYTTPLVTETNIKNDDNDIAKSVATTTVSGGKNKLEPGVSLTIVMHNSKKANSYDAKAILGNFIPMNVTD